MTTSVLETDIEIDPSDIIGMPQPCDGLPFDTLCENEAVYRCEVSCCHHILFWCENCLLGFTQWARMHEWTWARCIFCDRLLVVRWNHISVLGRL